MKKQANQSPDRALSNKTGRAKSKTGTEIVEVNFGRRKSETKPIEKIWSWQEALDNCYWLFIKKQLTALKKTAQQAEITLKQGELGVGKFAIFQIKHPAKTVMQSLETHCQQLPGVVSVAVVYDRKDKGKAVLTITW